MKKLIILFLFSLNSILVFGQSATINSTGHLVAPANTTLITNLAPAIEVKRNTTTPVTGDTATYGLVKVGNEFKSWNTKLNKWVGLTANYITPEMFGAIGDGTTDDYVALQMMFDTAIIKKILNSI